jgi:prolipoprotein diacylglyceryltransferase
MLLAPKDPFLRTGILGYALFYGLDKLADNPLWLFEIWEGGMSFHRDFVGVLVAPLVPIGLGASTPLTTEKTNPNGWLATASRDSRDDNTA